MLVAWIIALLAAWKTGEIFYWVGGKFADWYLQRAREKAIIEQANRIKDEHHES